jgi:hypothetical protein
MIALGALAVAFWVGRRQVKQSAEQTALQARVTAIEEARRTEEVEARRRALVTASFGALGIRAMSNYDRRHPHLFLKNEGSAQARRVDVKVAALDKNSGSFEVLRLADDLPIDLHPGTTSEVRARVQGPVAPGSGRCPLGGRRGWRKGVLHTPDTHRLTAWGQAPAINRARSVPAGCTSSMNSQVKEIGSVTPM